MAVVAFSVAVVYKQVQIAPATTNWYKIPITTFPSKDSGIFLSGIYIRLVDTAGSVKGDFMQIQINPQTDPSGSDPGFLILGTDGIVPVPGNINTLWVKLGTSTDKVNIIAWMP